jgi:hypothetical protein|tara:strand:+ start:259 stop:456 length:198 start_codon:yes stop_codon:yes gene_type:complete
MPTQQVPWTAIANGKKYPFRFDDLEYGGDPGEGLDYFLDEVWDGGPSGEDWDPTITHIHPDHWLR